MTNPTPPAPVSDDLETLLGSIDVDFGYAVGNLNMDTTLESRTDIMAKFAAHIQRERLEARLDERTKVGGEITKVANMYAHHRDLSPLAKMREINRERIAHLTLNNKETA